MTTPTSATPRRRGPCSTTCISPTAPPRPRRRPDAPTTPPASAGPTRRPSRRSTARASGRSAAPPTRRGSRGTARALGALEPARLGPPPLDRHRSSPSSTSWRAAQRHYAPATSNAVLVDGRHTASGRPIAVFGPQVGYQMPSFLVEKDVHGPGIDARGVGFAGIDAYVLLGRGRDYAWSATSSGADNTDTFVLRLCDPAGGAATVSSMGYEHDGKCSAITRSTTRSGPRRSAAARPAPRSRGPCNARPTTGRSCGAARCATARRSRSRASARRTATRSRRPIGFQRLNDPAVMRAGYPAFKRRDRRAHRLHVQLVLRGRRHDRVRALVQVPAPRARRRPRPPGHGHREVGLDRVPRDLHASRPTSTPRTATSRRGTTSRRPGFRASDARVLLRTRPPGTAAEPRRRTGVQERAESRPEPRRRRRADDERGDPRPARRAGAPPTCSRSWRRAPSRPGSTPAARPARTARDLGTGERSDHTATAKTRGAPVHRPGRDRRARRLVAAR